MHRIAWAGHFGIVDLGILSTADSAILVKLQIVLSHSLCCCKVLNFQWNGRFGEKDV